MTVILLFDFIINLLFSHTVFPYLPRRGSKILPRVLQSRSYIFVAHVNKLFYTQRSHKSHFNKHLFFLFYFLKKLNS